MWKFPIQITDYQTVKMPRGAKILTAQMQGEQMCLWARVKTTAEPKVRHIVIHGTGHPVDPEERYIATAQSHGGALVWHVFELGE